jgi:hypothetical protein
MRSTSNKYKSNMFHNLSRVAGCAKVDDAALGDEVAAASKEPHSEALVKL